MQSVHQKAKAGHYSSGDGFFSMTKRLFEKRDRYSNGVNLTFNRRGEKNGHWLGGVFSLMLSLALIVMFGYMIFVMRETNMDDTYQST
jgi:hypothetical protein